METTSKIPGSFMIIGVEVTNDAVESNALKKNKFK
jgi:hypothetical protein